MQKHATRSGWRIVVRATAPAALTLLISIAGLHVSAGRMERGGPVVGYEPTSGLWGAEGGVKLYANRGPVEHQRSFRGRARHPMSPTKRELNMGRLFHSATEQSSLRLAWQRIRANGSSSSAVESRIAIEMFDRDERV